MRESADVDVDAGGRNGADRDERGGDVYMPAYHDDEVIFCLRLRFWFVRDNGPLTLPLDT